VAYNEVLIFVPASPAVKILENAPFALLLVSFHIVPETSTVNNCVLNGIFFSTPQAQVLIIRIFPKSSPVLVVLCPPLELLTGTDIAALPSASQACPGETCPVMLLFIPGPVILLALLLLLPEFNNAESSQYKRPLGTSSGDTDDILMPPRFNSASYKGILTLPFLKLMTKFTN